MTKRIVVIGAGISGLSAAYYLLKERSGDDADSHEIVVLESAARAGGVVESVDCDGALMEFGPESFLTDKPGVLDLARRLGLEKRIVGTSEIGRKTLVAFERRLHPVPDGFVMLAPTQLAPLMATPLFSLIGKLRMAMEPFVRTAAAVDDESLAAFVTRRLGKEALHRLAEPLIGGIYGGEADDLSALSTVPRMVSLERSYGSIVRGLLMEMRKSGDRKRVGQGGARYGLIASFDRGMGVLVDRLVEELPPGTLRLGAEVDRLVTGAGDRRFRVGCRDGTIWDADAVILAMPAQRAATVLQDANAEIGALMGGIEYSSSVISNWLFKCADLPVLPTGFGFVVPNRERAAINACTFASVKFARRAAEGTLLLRVFVGGAGKAGIADSHSGELESMIARDLFTYLGITSDPVAVKTRRHRLALPQYRVGHTARVESLSRLVATMPGLALAGNAYGGVGVPDCVKSGEEAARAVLSQLRAA